MYTALLKKILVKLYKKTSISILTKWDVISLKNIALLSCYFMISIVLYEL